MDSFFDLFDPSDGQSKPSKKRCKPEDNVKKKTDGPPKGRRRGRRSQGKNETLPEESSFLCEPDLSSEVLVKHGSYIENYIEVNKGDDAKADESKTKRRNSTRKNRRKKSKTTPDKEFENDDLLNNQSSVARTSDGNVGKNVNDLRMNTDRNRQDFKEYSIIDKLEMIGVKDEEYLMEDYELDLDGYSSDEMDETDVESSSDEEDGFGEMYGSLPPEPRFGNVEYKLRLVSPCEKRFQHLVTQLKWRLGWGGGSAVYVVGVRDCGALTGLRGPALRASLRTLRRMARALRAGSASVKARRLHGRTVAEVCIRKLADPQSVEMRVAVMGANEAGKSTLIGVLTQGELDNGRGSARLNMFRHVHEVRSGRTSSLSHEILGFDAQGNVVNYGCSELMTAERIGERSAKLVSFLDLAGHAKYQRTTLHGLTGYSPHYVMLLISATAGITCVTEEHISLLVALRLPFFVVINKCELTSGQDIIDRLAELVPKKPLLIKDEAMARQCAATQRARTDDDEESGDGDDGDVTAVFMASCVRGAGLRELTAFLLNLPVNNTRVERGPEPCEFQIDEVFHLGGEGGVVGGLLVRGELHEGETLLVGPLPCGSFVPALVSSIYRARVATSRVAAGRSASLGLRPQRGTLRPGMVLLTQCNEKTKQTTKNHKNFRRKNSNLLQEIANVEHCLSKHNVNQDNVFTESDDKFNNNQENNGKNNGASHKNIDASHKNYDASHKNNDASHKNNDASHKNNDASHKIIDASVNDMSNKKNDNTHNALDVNDNFDDKQYDSDDRSDDSDDDDDKKVDDDYRFGDLRLENLNEPRGCIFFQAQIQVLRHTSAISVGFQCSVHVGNVRQTAVVEGILSHNSTLRVNETASCVFRFVRCPEYLVRGRRLLLTAGLGTRAIGRITQTFPYYPST